MRESITINSGTLREDIAHTLIRFVQAEQSGNAALAQKAYEDLFVLCYRNDLDLSALLDEMEESGCGADPGWPATMAPVQTTGISACIPAPHALISSKN